MNRAERRAEARAKELDPEEKAKRKTYKGLMPTAARDSLREIGYNRAAKVAKERANKHMEKRYGKG